MSTRKYFFSIFVTMLTFMSLAAEARSYHIYGERLKGTKFKESLYSWPVPFRKSYEELSEKHKAIVRQDYPELAVGDKPPYPVKGMHSIIEPYVREFRYYGVGSGGELIISIDEIGRVGRINASPETHAHIVEFIAKISKRVEFEPGTCAGAPCVMDFKLILKPIKNPRIEAK